MAEKPKRTSDSRPMPGLNVRELIAERNWAALGGLALIAIGALYALQAVLGFDLDLWALLLIVLGGWLVFDAWQRDTGAVRQWGEPARSRALVGGLLLLIGILGIVDINWWGLLLLGVAGWLGYDAWQRVQAAGNVWTTPARNRAVAAAVIGAVGLLGFMNLGSAWAVVLIAFGGLMIFRHFSRG